MIANRCGVIRAPNIDDDDMTYAILVPSTRNMLHNRAPNPFVRSYDTPVFLVVVVVVVVDTTTAAAVAAVTVVGNVIGLDIVTDTPTTNLLNQ
jgi:hypothetical protein